MKYEILMPKAEELDPRNRSWSAMSAFYDEAPPFLLLDSEEQAAREAFGMHPDALGMMVPVSVGSGVVPMVGIVAHWANIPSLFGGEVHIPFVLFVHAKPESAGDIRAIQKQSKIKGTMFFRQSVWRTPVLPAPTDGDLIDAELRATDLDYPRKVNATCGTRTGRDGVTRKVIRVEIDGVAMSLEFDEDPFG